MTSPVAAKQIEAVLQAVVQPGPADASTQQLGDKFKSMMDQPPMAAPSRNNEGTGLVSAMAAQQDAQLQQSVNDTVSMMQDAPFMSMQEMTAATMRVTLEIASTQLDMEAKMGIVNSSKSAVETLMKNQ